MVLTILGNLADRGASSVAVSCLAAVDRAAKIISDCGGRTFIEPDAERRIGLTLTRNPNWRQVLIDYARFRRESLQRAPVAPEGA